MDVNALFQNALFIKKCFFPALFSGTPKRLGNSAVGYNVGVTKGAMAPYSTSEHCTYNDQTGLAIYCTLKSNINTKTTFAVIVDFF